MNEIRFSKEEKELMVKKTQLYFSEELGSEIGPFDTQFLIDFFAKEIGCYFYNRGLYDAQAVLEKRLQHITDAIYDLEKRTEFRR